MAGNKIDKVFITDRIADPHIEESILGGYLARKPDRDVRVLLVWHERIDDAYLDRFPNLTGIIRYGVGFDAIDLNACKKRNVVVCNTPDYCTEEVSHTAVAMILNITRSIIRYDALARFYESGWQEHVLPDVGRTSSQTVGFIGVGRIGSLTLQSCRSLRYHTQFHDPYVSDGYDKILNAKRNNDLADLLESSDIVSLHCPLNAETRSMVDEAFIMAMKPGASLVNTARGRIISDLDVLYEGLRSNRLSAVSLDVLPEEPPSAHPLIRAWREKEEWLAGRLIINPHAAYHSAESHVEQRRKAAENALQAITSGRFNNIVSR